MLKKIMSEIVALVFIFSVTSVDFARAAVMPVQSLNSPGIFNDTAILQNYAKVTSLKNFNSDTVVLNIQDFHMHSGVQQNINSIIKSLSDNCNVQYIYLEGAYDKVNTDWLSNIENKEFKQAIIEKLVKDGKLTGAEIYSINNNKKNFILPLEDKTIHKENIKRLAKIIKEKPEVLNKLDKREKELSFYQKKYLGSDNIKFSEIVKKYNSGKLDTYDFYKSLFSYVKKYQQTSKHRYSDIIDLSIDDYPNMDMYLQVYEIQKRINLKDLTEQLKIIIKNLKQELSYSEYSKFLANTNNFTDKYALIASLDKLPAEYKQKYISKQLNDFIKSVKLQKNINPVELIDEERALVGQIRSVLSQNKAELEVSFLIDFFKYFKDFMLANISADDHQYFMGQIDKFINLWNKYSFYDKPMLELLERIPFINEYYAVNDYRNEIFMKKLNIANNNISRKELPTRSFSSLIGGKKIAIVITGGYHTKGLTELLSKNNVSYAVITPTVLANIDNTYEKYEAAVKEEAAIASQTLASAAISLIGLEQSYVIDLLKEIQKDNNFNLDDVVNFIEVLNETKEQKIEYNYDKQNQKLTLSDENTQIIISKDNVETKMLKKQASVGFGIKKILKVISENLKFLSMNFGQDIFYPNLFNKLDEFETFLIERNLMPAISNGFIYEINNDIEFQQYYTEKYGEEKLEELSQATRIIQLVKYYEYKANNQSENEESLKDVIAEMEKLNYNGQLLAETGNIDYINELRLLENSVMGKLNYKPEYAVYAAGGRIGQPDVWKLAERQDVELSMITVSPRLSKDEIPYSVSHDSGLKIQKDNKGVHGDFDGTVEWYKDNELTEQDMNKYKENDAFVGYLKMVSNKTGKVSKVAVFQTYNPEDVKFDNLLVLNTSGKYKTEEEAEVFLKQGANMVALSAPGEMPTYTNGTREAYKGEKIFSGASCSTNALQSVLLPISENGRIQSVRFGGAHSRTNSEGDKEYGFEPHSSGAFKATVKLPGLQYLKGQIIGNVNRISDVMDGSILDVTIQLEEPIKGGAEEINKILKQASQGKYKNVLGYQEESSNVSDIVGRTEAGVLQADQTMVSADGKTVQLAVWYDNEVGYANQYLDLSYYAGMFGTMKNGMLELLNIAGINTKQFEKDATLEDIYKIFRHDVMIDGSNMEIIKGEAEKGNEVAKSILNLMTTISQNDVLNIPEGPAETFVSEDLLVQAKIGGYAVGAYNMNNLDQLKAIVDAASSSESPLMIEISEGAFGYSADNPMGMEKFNYLVETYKMIAATRPDLEMILHLDHAKNIDVAKKAIDMGFSSVMLDYSKEEISKNKQATKELVEYAHKRGARVEAEIGAVDLGDQGYTTPEQALDFVKATNVDSLAIAVGTAHGANKNNPQLQFMLIAEIAYELYKNGIKTPLVLHGASAVPQELIKRFNSADGKKENASGVPMGDTQSAVRWDTLLEAAKDEIEAKKQDKNFDYETEKNKFEQIQKEISDKDMLEQGVISKVNVATDILVAGAVAQKESIKEGIGIDHIAEQEEATKLVSGKMKDLGSKDKVTAQKAKQKVTLPKKAIKPAKELINKENVKQYNIGSIEEIQAVVNNSKAGDNIIFTIDENTAERFSFAGYKDAEHKQKYNALVFAIEIAAQNNKDINIAVNLIKSQDIDKILTNILKKSYQYNEKEGAFELKLDNLSNDELIYLSGAIKDGAIMDLKEIADDITEKFHKYQNDKHDVRDWGKQYRNIIWQLLEDINNDNIEKYINRENDFETIDEVSDEIGKLDGQRRDFSDETDYVEELRIIEEKLDKNIYGKAEYAVYAALGRIGQPVVWKLAERQDVELSMITVSPRYIDGKSKESLPKEIAHDSGLKIQTDNNGVHGDFDGTVEWYKDSELTEQDKTMYKDNPTFGGYLKMVSNKTGKVSKVAVFGTYEPADVDFTGKTVLNTSGKYKTEEEAEVFIKQGGADMVVLSAPGEMPTYTNGTREAYKGEKIFSGASCSTNALQSVLLPISENGRIQSVRFGGAHSRTNSEGDKEYGFEPHSSGAFKATVKLPGLQYLKGQIIGNVNRISDVMDGSILDVTIQLEEPIKGGAEEINKILKQASQGKYKNVLGYQEESSNVSDIVGRTEAGVLQADQTMVSADGKTVQLAVWYDNEVGYANQYMDLSIYANKSKQMKKDMIDLLKEVGVRTKELAKEDITLKQVYKILRDEVITNEEKMNIITQEAEKGNYAAQTIVELAQEKDIKPVETKTIKIEKSETSNFFKAGWYFLKSTFNSIIGESNAKIVDIDLVYVEDFQDIPQKKFNKNDNEIKLYVSSVKDPKGLEPAGIKGVYINKHTGVIYISQGQSIDVVTSNMSGILRNFMNVDNTDFDVVVSNEDSVNEDVLSIDDNGVIKTSVEFSDAARNIVKTLKSVMNRNLVVMIEGDEINDIENQLNVMKKIGNNTITVSAKYFNKSDDIVKDELINLEKNYGISVIIEYDSDIDEKTEIENAKLGFVGHTIKTADGFMYENYSLNEKITNYATLSTIEDIENFSGIRSSNEVVFIKGNALVSYVKESAKLGNKIDAISILTGIVTKFVKFINEDIDENLIENFVFELPKENIPKISQDKINELQNIEDLTILRNELNIRNVQELILFEAKIIKLAKEQNKDTEQLLLIYYQTILKAAYLNNRFYNEHPSGFENKNITKMVERNVVIQIDELQQQQVGNIIETVDKLKGKMNAEGFMNFVYELAYNLDAGNIQEAQKLLSDIGFEGEIKDNTIVKSAVFELLILFADRRLDINIDKNNDIDDMRNVANILTAA